MTRLKAAVARLFTGGGDKRTAAVPAADTTVRTLRRQLDDLTRALAALDDRLEHSLGEADRQLRLQREQLFEQASLAAVPRARLLSESIVLEGRPSERMRIRRLRVGEPVERRFSPWVGITRCASDAPEVRELWERLLGFEAECGDDVLRGSPCTILDVPGASASIVEGKLRVVPTRAQPSSADVVAVPRCTYDVTTRKIANFGHWMLDWAPQVVALWKVAPGATFLMPQPARAFHAETLARIGLDVRRMVPWDGAPVACGRLLAFESDGRTGGGRPLSPLMDVRRLLAPRDGTPASRTRRIYVSRRDAPKKRTWIVNEADVEELFRRRGFEVIVMRDYSLDEQIRAFREARVVAGLNGGGLTDIIFSASGIDVIVLLSDTLIRWYAGGGRSVWTGGRRGGAGQLAALGDSPRFWTHVAVTFEQRCHSFVGGDEMPLVELARFLDDVLAGIEAAP